jgi:hypothetical protein
VAQEKERTGISANAFTGNMTLEEVNYSSIVTQNPLFVSSVWPTSQPTSQPTGDPTTQPTGQPSGQPTGQPTSMPSIYFHQYDYNTILLTGCVVIFTLLVCFMVTERIAAAHRHKVLDKVLGWVDKSEVEDSLHADEEGHGMKTSKMALAKAEKYIMVIDRLSMGRYDSEHDTDVKLL